jgi:hypothetical protein
VATAETDSPPATKLAGPRFSLPWLLVVTAAVAVLVAPISWLGAIYVVYLVFALVAFFTALLAVRWRATFLAVVTNVGCVLLPLLGIVVSTALAVQAAVTIVGLLATTRWADRPRLRSGVCYAGLAAGYLFGIAHALSTNAELERIRSAVRPVSLRPRLAEASKPHAVSLSAKQRETLDVIDGEHDYQQARWWQTDRAAAYERLHEEAFRQFTSATGFGVARFPYIDLATYDTRRAEATRLPWTFVSPSRRALHDRVTASFASRNQLGNVVTVDETTGFLAHHVELSPEQRQGGKRVRLERLDLVSLLLHKDPVVYVSDQLPDMEKLRDAPTRELDEFEEDALAQLRGPKDLVFERTPSGDGTRVRMLGAVRAAKSCLVCHETQRGALLGAFSYKLFEPRRRSMP